MNLKQLKRYAKTRNHKRKNRKSRRASKRSRRSSKQRGGSWAYEIPDEAVVGRTSDEGVQVFKTMKDVREENSV